MAANRKKLSFLEGLAFIAYIILLVYFLFFADSFGRNENAGYRYNLEPFKEILRFYRAESLSIEVKLINLAGNIVAFVPLGYFFPRLSRKVESVFSTVIFCCAFSIIVEIIQYVSRKGSCDIDDIILNTLGGLCGYIIYFIVHRLILGRKNKKRNDLSGEEKKQI